MQARNSSFDALTQNDAMLLPVGGWRRVFRVGWVLLAILSLFTFSLVLYYTYEFVQNPPQRISQGLAEMGWSSDFYLWFNVFFLILSYAAYFIVALLIFLLRPQERMALFASVIPGGVGALDHPVLDQTGLANVDLNLEWAQVAANFASGEEFHPDESAPSFEQALKEQLGLKLDPQKGPVEFFVIDHLEMPSEN